MCYLPYDMPQQNATGQAMLYRTFVHGDQSLTLDTSLDYTSRGITGFNQEDYREQSITKINTEHLAQLNAFLQ